MMVFLAAGCRTAAEPEAAVDLAGTGWVMSSLNGNLPLAGTTVTLEFGTDGTVAGSDGCNRFSTGFTQDGAALTIIQPAATTDMACPDPVMAQAAAFMATLASVTGFTATGNQLSLLAGDQIVATFVAAPADGETPAGPDLAGTGWLLSTLNGEMPVTGTAASIRFGADGTATGTDGCNNFNTTFTQDGSSLTINPAGASTMMACPEPVMAQAAAFTDALARTDSFTIDYDTLSLLAGSEVAATFVAQSADLAGTAWDVVSYNNGREAVVGLIEGTEISANFGVEGDLTGSAGCRSTATGWTSARPATRSRCWLTGFRKSQTGFAGWSREPTGKPDDRHSPEC